MGKHQDEIIQPIHKKQRLNDYDAAMQMKLRELQNQIKEIKSQRDELEYKIQATSLKNDNNMGNWMQKELPNDDAIICSCKKQSSGKIIKCDNTACKIQWFHWKCVGVKKTRRAEWYCPDCRRYSYCTNSLHPKFKKSKILKNKKEIKIDKKNDDEFIEFLINKPDPNSDQKAMIRMRKTQTFGNAFAILEKRFDKRITLSFNGNAINNNWTPQELINYFDFVNGDLIDTKYE